MTFKRGTFDYSIIVSFQGGCNNTFVLDTGAPFTVMSLTTLIKIVHQIPEDFIKSQDLFISKGYGGTKVQLLPCYIRNVTIDDLHFPIFYFMLNVSDLFLKSTGKKDKSNDLIGFDVIDACTCKSEAGLDFLLSDFHVESYADYWRSIAPNAFEICNITCE